MREVIGNWKAGKKPASSLELRPGLLGFHVGNSFLAPQLNQAASMGGGFGGPNPFAKVAQSLSTSKADVQVAITVASGVGAEVSLFTPTAEQITQLKADIEATRNELKPMAAMLTAMGGPAGAGDAIQAALNAPLDGTGNRVSLSIPLPPEASAELFRGIGNMVYKIFEAFEPSSARNPGGPGMPPGMPGMPPGMPTTPGMPTGMPGMPPGSNPAMHIPPGAIPMPGAQPTPPK